VSFVIQCFVFSAFFTIQEVKTAFITAEHMFFLETETHKQNQKMHTNVSKNKARICFPR